MQILYCKFLGVSKLSEKNDFPVVDEDFDPEDAPFVIGSDDVLQVRFHWQHDAKHVKNQAGIRTIMAFARSHGPEYVSGVGPLLECMTEEHMLQRFFWKYGQLRKVYKETSGRQSTKPGSGFNRTKGANRGRGVCSSPCQCCDAILITR